jgi:uncharacterized protein YciW
MVTRNTLNPFGTTMTQISQHPAGSDTLDRILGLTSGSVVFDTRHQRSKVVDATQASEDLLLGSPIEGLSLQDRLLVALLACALTPCPELAQEYTERLNALGASPETIRDLSAGQITQTLDARLKQILLFTQTLILDPLKADKQALLALQSSGLTTAQITALAQLIAFVSYQVRVCAGLKAMKQWGVTL